VTRLKWPMRLVMCLTCFCCSVCCTFASAQVTPTEVYRKVELIAAEIDLIRREMGVAPNAKVPFNSKAAQPREVYFQALTLLKKSNRLLFEQLREKDKEPDWVMESIQPEDVLAIVNRSHLLLLRVKEYLLIEETVETAPAGEEFAPSDVFRLIVDQNRTLNQLLQQRFAPADVYQQLTYGVGVAGSILATLPVSVRLGTEPDFERRKTPTDVYVRLLLVFEKLCAVMDKSGEACLQIAPEESQRLDVTPSDVYDLSSLVVSELLYLHTLRGNASSPKAAYYPGEKLPSHVYQRAGRLLSQVMALEQHVLLNPEWLEH